MDDANEDIAAPEPVDVRLAGGSEVRVRLLVPADEAILRGGLEHLSSRAAYQRFLTPDPHLSETQFDYLMNPDQRTHLAIVMGIEDEEGRTVEGIGVARCIRGGESPDESEVAVTVVDKWQGKGAGSLLLRHLAAFAYRTGVRRFRGVMLVNNAAVQHALDHLGERVESTTPEMGVVEVVWALDPERFAV